MAKISMDSAAQKHVSQRIQERIKESTDQKKMVDVIKKLITLTAPAEAVGQFQYHIKVGSIGRVLLRGVMVRTVYSYNESYPNSPEYKISGSTLVKA